MASRSHAFNGAAVIAAAVCSLPTHAQAPNDAICALQQAVACATVDACERTLPEGVNLPVLLRIDLGARAIESRREDGTVRTSEIASSATHGDALLLQGNDEGHPWTMRVNIESGRFSMTVLREDVGFIGFGVCSAKILK